MLARLEALEQGGQEQRPGRSEGSGHHRAPSRPAHAPRSPRATRRRRPAFRVRVEQASCPVGCRDGTGHEVRDGNRIALHRRLLLRRQRRVASQGRDLRGRRRGACVPRCAATPQPRRRAARSRPRQTRSGAPRRDRTQAGNARAVGAPRSRRRPRSVPRARRAPGGACAGRPRRRGSRAGRANGRRAVRPPPRGSATSPSLRSPRARVRRCACLLARVGSMPPASGAPEGSMDLAGGLHGATLSPWPSRFSFAQRGASPWSARLCGSCARRAARCRSTWRSASGIPSSRSPGRRSSAPSHVATGAAP